MWHLFANALGVVMSYVAFVVLSRGSQCNLNYCFQ